MRCNRILHSCRRKQNCLILYTGPIRKQGVIINTGGRTDTVNYYSDWLLRRFREGYVLVRNPYYPRTVLRYELDPAVVDCVVFCSKNYAPILPRLHEITDRFNTYFHYTITAYGKDIEPAVPSIEESMGTLKELSSMVGKGRVAWRYDPVLLTPKYTTEVHLETFERMAGELSPYVDRCIFSFVEMYRKLEVNMPTLRAVAPEQMDILAEGMGRIARNCGLAIQTCGHKEDFSRFGIQHSGCMTPDILGDANGCLFRKISGKGVGGATRQGCGCMPTRDIGAYNSCPNGCRYCYANRNPELARRNLALHDPASPMLLGHLEEGDTVRPAVQESFLSCEMRLF